MSLGVLAPKSPDLKRYFVGGAQCAPPLSNRVKFIILLKSPVCYKMKLFGILKNVSIIDELPDYTFYV